MARQKQFPLGNILFSDHSVVRMFERNITEEHVEELIAKGEVIETYPDDRPDPSYLLLGWAGNRPLHAVVGFNDEEQRCTVITIYEPDLLKFEDDYKTRRK